MVANAIVLLSQFNELLASSIFSLDVEIKREGPAKESHLSPLPTVPRNRSERAPGEKTHASGKEYLLPCTALAEQNRFPQFCHTTLHAILHFHVCAVKGLNDGDDVTQMWNGDWERGRFAVIAISLLDRDKNWCMLVHNTVPAVL